MAKQFALFYNLKILVKIQFTTVAAAILMLLIVLFSYQLKNLYKEAQFMMT